MSTENLKVIITGDASGLSKTTAQASASMAQVSQSAADWDARARQLNQDMNYTARSSAQVGQSWASLGKQGQVVAQRLKDIQAARAAAQGGATKMVKTMEESAAGSIRTQYALSDLSRGLEGFNTSTSAGINGIARFAHEFTYLQQQSGSTKGAFMLLKESIAGPIGIIFGIGLLINIVNSLIQKYGSLDAAILALSGDGNDQVKNQMSLNKAFSDGAKSMESSISGLFMVQNAVKLAEGGYISASTAVGMFNKTLGTTLGSVNSLAEAQEKLNNKSKDYITATVDKAVATQLLSQASGEVVKNLTLQAKTDAEAATTWQKIGNFFTATVLQSGNPAATFLANTFSGAKTKAKSQIDTENDVNRLQDQALKASQDATKILKTIFDDKTGGGGGSVQTVADIMKTLNENLATADAKGRIFGASIEQIATMKMKALNDAMEALAKIHTPAAIAKAKELGKQYEADAKAAFLKPLTGGRAQINAPAGITGNPDVPTYINPNLGYDPLNTHNRKTDAQSARAWNEEMQPLLKTGRQLDQVFQSTFTTIANGGNAFQTLAQAVEQLVIKLAAAAAAAIVISDLTGGAGSLFGGGSVGFADIFKGLSGIGHFATGGYIPSPQLAVVGDAPGGEWVLNQRQISAILNGVGGGRNVQVTGRIEAEGSTLAVVLNNANKKAGRRNG